MDIGVAHTALLEEAVAPLFTAAESVVGQWLAGKGPDASLRHMLVGLVGRVDGEMRLPSRTTSFA